MLGDTKDYYYVSRKTPTDSYTRGKHIYLYGSSLSPETAQLLEKDLPYIGLEYLLPVMPYTPPLFFSMKG